MIKGRQSGRLLTDWSQVGILPAGPADTSAGYYFFSETTWINAMCDPITPNSGRLLICRTSWMDRYAGDAEGDPLISFNPNLPLGPKDPFEIFNFLDNSGTTYGHVRTRYTNIKIERLGAIRGANSVSGVTVIWTAKPSLRERVVVIGWYQQATIYRNLQQSALPTERITNKGTLVPWNIEADTRDVYLVPSPSRATSVVPTREGGPGISSIFFADSQTATIKRFRKRMFDLVSQRTGPK